MAAVRLEEAAAVNMKVQRMRMLGAVAKMNLRLRRHHLYERQTAALKALAAGAARIQREQATAAAAVAVAGAAKTQREQATAVAAAVGAAKMTARRAPVRLPAVATVGAALRQQHRCQLQNEQEGRKKLQRRRLQQGRPLKRCLPTNRTC